jgi:ribose transport system substrate-binding protein
VPTTTNAQQRTAGFKDAMDAAQMKIVSVQSGNWEIDKGNAVAASMLNEYPDLKALLAGNDSMALGAVSAVRAGKAGQQVVGYDNINAIKPMLKDGRVLATLDQAASQQAVFGIQAALKMVKGEKPDVDADNVIQTRSNSSPRSPDAARRTAMPASANEVVLAAWVGKTYAQPVLGDVSLSCAPAKCWR